MQILESILVQIFLWQLYMAYENICVRLESEILKGVISLQLL